jgi:VWFA-related protein
VRQTRILRRFTALLSHEKRDTLMTRTTLLLALALLLAMGTVPPSQAQLPASPQRAPQTQQRGPLIVPTNNVIVPVTVKDGSGRLVGDLRRDEFRIFADGIEQQVVYFSAESVPLSAVILIGTSLPRGASQEVQNSLKSIAAAFGPRDEFALVTYQEFQNTVLDFTSNNDQLFTQLSRLELESYSTVYAGGTIGADPQVNGQPLPTGTGVKQHGSQRHDNHDALHDALYAAGDLLKDRGRDRRKVVFLISQGANSNHNVHSFEDTLHHLQFSDISVFSISVTPTVRIAKSWLQKGAADIQKYTYLTGGESFVASKQPDLERLYSDVTEQARNEYTLAFSPQGVPRDQDFHSVEVRVTRPGLNITARQGYYTSAMTIGR